MHRFDVRFKSNIKILNQNIYRFFNIHKSASINKIFLRVVVLNYYNKNAGNCLFNIRFN